RGRCSTSCSISGATPSPAATRPSAGASTCRSRRTTSACGCTSSPTSSRIRPSGSPACRRSRRRSAWPASAATCRSASTSCRRAPRDGGRLRHASGHRARVAPARGVGALDDTAEPRGATAAGERERIMNIFKAQAVKDPEAIARAIPVINVAPAFAGGAGLERVAAQVREASERVGFFYVKGYGVPPAVIDAAFAASREFHALPLEDKLALKLNQNNIGYLP